MKTLWPGILVVAVALSTANATPAQVNASAALATAERLCALPGGAEFVEWHVVSTDSTGYPSPVAEHGRYWLVVGRFNFPSDGRPATVLIPVPKAGGRSTGCSIIPAPDIRPETGPHSPAEKSN